MMKTFASAHRFMSGAVYAVALCGSTACAPQGDSDDLGGTSEALDNAPADSNDGKTCYVDGPIAGRGKGSMDDGFCCVQRDKEQVCYYCGDPVYECQVAGGATTVSITVNGAQVGSGDTQTTTPPRVTTSPPRSVLVR
jgi:hypothetical protein